MEYEFYKTDNHGRKTHIGDQIYGLSYTQGATFTVKVLEIGEEVYMQIPYEILRIDGQGYKAGITDEYFSKAPTIIPAVAHADGGKEGITCWVENASRKYVTIGVRNDAKTNKNDITITYSILTGGHYYAFGSRYEEQIGDMTTLSEWYDAIKALVANKEV